MTRKAILLAVASLFALGITPARAETASEAYQRQQAEYQRELNDYKAARGEYEREVARYDWSKYRRYPREWPAAYTRYSEDSIYGVPARNLIDSRVDARDGSRIGMVHDIDVDTAGRLRGVQVDMPGNRYVWIEGPDLRYDPDTRTLYTFLSKSQIRGISFRG